MKDYGFRVFMLLTPPIAMIIGGIATMGIGSTNGTPLFVSLPVGFALMLMGIGFLMLSIKGVKNLQNQKSKA